VVAAALREGMADGERHDRRTAREFESGQNIWTHFRAFVAHVVQPRIFLAAPGTTWQWGVAAGLLAGVGWIVAMFIVIALFEQRSLKYILINCGYITVYFAVIGFILGIWR